MAAGPRCRIESRGAVCRRSARGHRYRRSRRGVHQNLQCSRPTIRARRTGRCAHVPSRGDVIRSKQGRRAGGRPPHCGRDPLSQSDSYPDGRSAAIPGIDGDMVKPCCGHSPQSLKSRFAAASRSNRIPIRSIRMQSSGVQTRNPDPPQHGPYGVTGEPGREAAPLHRRRHWRDSSWMPSANLRLGCLPPLPSSPRLPA